MEDPEDRFHRLMKREIKAAKNGPANYNDPYWRLTELDIFESQYLNGGLQQWYANPCGQVWRETVSALGAIGFPELARSLTAMCGSLEQAMGDRRLVDLGVMSDADLDRSYELTEPYEELPQSILEDGSFYAKACDWWEGVLSRRETKRVLPPEST